MTKLQEEQFNRMLAALRQIARFQAPEELRRLSWKSYGLDYAEALEMAYENVRWTAKQATYRVHEIKRS